ncbi:MAG: hypothetical protein V4490_00790 [Pseudomonadota bacterium]
MFGPGTELQAGEIAAEPITTLDALSAKYTATPRDFRAFADRHDEFHRDMISLIMHTVQTGNNGANRARGIVRQFFQSLSREIVRTDPCPLNLGSTINNTESPQVELVPGTNIEFCAKPLVKIDAALNRYFRDSLISYIKLSEQYYCLIIENPLAERDPEFLRKCKVPRISLSAETGIAEFRNSKGITNKLYRLESNTYWLSILLEQLDRATTSGGPEAINQWLYSCHEFKCELTVDGEWFFCCARLNPPAEFSERVLAAYHFIGQKMTNADGFLRQIPSIGEEVSAQELQEWREKLSTLISSMPGQGNCEWLKKSDPQSVLIKKSLRCKDFTRQNKAIYETIKVACGVGDAEENKKLFDEHFKTLEAAKQEINGMIAKENKSAEESKNKVTGIIFLTILVFAISAVVGLASMPAAIAIAGLYLTLLTISVVSTWVKKAKAEAASKNEAPVADSAGDVGLGFSKQPEPATPALPVLSSLSTQNTEMDLSRKSSPLSDHNAASNPLKA